MDVVVVKKILVDELNFTNENIEKLSIFHNELINYNKEYNLISKNTENDVWERHILDSAQILKFIEQFQNKDLPSMPVGAKFLMEKYQIPEGKKLGNKLKNIEEEWVNNNFKLSEKQIDKIVSR